MSKLAKDVVRTQAIINTQKCKLHVNVKYLD